MKDYKADPNKMYDCFSISINRKRPNVSTQYQDKNAPLVPSPLNHSSLFTPVSSTHKSPKYFTAQSRSSRSHSAGPVKFNEQITKKPRFKSADMVSRARPPTRQPNAFPLGLESYRNENDRLTPIVESNSTSPIRPPSRHQYGRKDDHHKKSSFPLEADEGLQSLPLSSNIPVKIYRSTLSDTKNDLGSHSPFQNRESGTAPLNYNYDIIDNVYENGIPPTQQRPRGMSVEDWKQLRETDRELAEWEQSLHSRLTTSSFNDNRNRAHTPHQQQQQQQSSASSQCSSFTRIKSPLTNHSTHHSKKTNDCVESDFSSSSEDELVTTLDPTFLGLFAK